MERVVTVNLNGNAYQLETPAYDALQAYLARAEAALGANPDKAEILRDLEQAIAEKCATSLSPVKTVVAAAEMAKALEEMGPVQGEGAARETGSDAPADDTAGAAPKRRLYRVLDSARIAGVCAGLGAYYDVNPNMVRAAFVIATALTWGLFALVYVALVVFIPAAHTSEEWAAAHGAPFSAQDVIDRLRRDHNFSADTGRRWSRFLRREMRAHWRGRRWDNWGYGPPPAAQAAPQPPIGVVGAVFSVIFGIVYAVLQLALTIVVISVIYVLATQGAIGGWAPTHVEAWRTALTLFIVIAIVSLPLRMLRWSGYGWRHPYGYRGADGFVGLVILALIAWFAWARVPEAHQVMAAIPDAMAQLGQQMRAWLEQITQAR